MNVFPVSPKQNNAIDNKGKPPIDWAATWGLKETSDLLRKHGGKTGEELKAEGE